MRPGGGPARPQRSDAGHSAPAGPARTRPSASRRRADGPDRRARPGGDAAARGDRGRARAGPALSRAGRVRPARHGSGRASLPDGREPERPRRDRRGRGVRGAPRREQLALHDQGVRRGHRGGAPGPGRGADLPPRRVVRDQGRARLRGRASGPGRAARARLPGRPRRARPVRAFRDGRPAARARRPLPRKALPGSDARSAGRSRPAGGTPAGGPAARHGRRLARAAATVDAARVGSAGAAARLGHRPHAAAGPAGGHELRAAWGRRADPAPGPHGRGGGGAGAPRRVQHRAARGHPVRGGAAPVVAYRRPRPAPCRARRRGGVPGRRAVRAVRPGGGDRGLAHARVPGLAGRAGRAVAGRPRARGSDHVRGWQQRPAHAARRRPRHRRNAAERAHPRGHRGRALGAQRHHVEVPGPRPGRVLRRAARAAKLPARSAARHPARPDRAALAARGGVSARPRRPPGPDPGRGPPHLLGHGRGAAVPVAERDRRDRRAGHRQRGRPARRVRDARRRGNPPPSRRLRARRGRGRRSPVRRGRGPRGELPCLGLRRLARGGSPASRRYDQRQARRPAFPPAPVGPRRGERRRRGPSPAATVSRLRRLLERQRGGRPTFGRPPRWFG